MNKLPIVDFADGSPFVDITPATSHAAQTTFVAKKIKGPDGRHLWIDGNQKITARCGTYDAPRPNAFSLLQIDDCPYRTSLCSTACYVHSLERHAPETHAKYRHNSALIREILNGKTWRRISWSVALGRYIADNCPDFRWHVSGDVFSYKYAEWIRTVVCRSPGTRHWIYTRSVPFLEPFRGVRNLTVNLSADAENYAVMRRAAADYGFRLCYMTSDGAVPDDLPDGSVIFPDYGLRGGRQGTRSENPPGWVWLRTLDARQKAMLCPVDFYGKSEDTRCGPCDRCMVQP